MNTVVHVLRRMGGRATTLLPFSLLLGLLFQDFAAAMRPLLMPLAVILLMLALARTDWDRLRELLKRPGLAIALSLLNLIAVPLIVWPIWQSLGLWPGLIAALCLSAMAPGIISAATTAAFLRLDSSLALLISLLTNFLVPFTLPPLELYRTLRVVNPSPFMFYLRTPSATLVGSSPEIMVRVVDGVVTVRPRAGTRPRGATPEEDQALAAGLLADPKERAEHVMLIDLGRNDVGRVSSIGSVVLSDVMSIERYSHVMHITSNVTGRLTPGTTAFDALRACLPAGTVSGAPKIRAMQIIDELEPCKRGPYAGAVGYIDFGGAMDTCIALRTVVITGGKAYVQSGAGIVADSSPESEFQETLNKAKGLLVSLEMTAERLGQGAPPQR